MWMELCDNHSFVCLLFHNTRRILLVSRVGYLYHFVSVFSSLLTHSTKEEAEEKKAIRKQTTAATTAMTTTGLSCTRKLRTSCFQLRIFRNFFSVPPSHPQHNSSTQFSHRTFHHLLRSRNEYSAHTLSSKEKIITTKRLWFILFQDVLPVTGFSSFARLLARSLVRIVFLLLFSSCSSYWLPLMFDVIQNWLFLRCAFFSLGLQMIFFFFAFLKQQPTEGTSHFYGLAAFVGCNSMNFFIIGRFGRCFQRERASGARWCGGFLFLMAFVKMDQMVESPQAPHPAAERFHGVIAPHEIEVRTLRHVAPK